MYQLFLFVCVCVGEKRFEVLHELVEDGLISVYLSQHNVMQALEKGRDVTRRQSLRLKRKPCGYVINHVHIHENVHVLLHCTCVYNYVYLASPKGAKND